MALYIHETHAGACASSWLSQQQTSRRLHTRDAMRSGDDSDQVKNHVGCAATDQDVELATAEGSIE